MKFSNRRSITLILLVVALAIVVGNALFASRATQSLLDSKAWVDHTWQVIYELELVLGSVRDAETGARGFVLSGDDLYLAPYTRALQDLPLELDTCGRLTADNPRQQRRLIDLREVLEQRLALLARGIALRRSGEVGSIQRNVTSGAGRRLMEHSRELVSQMKNEEELLLVGRTRQARSAQARTSFAITLASVLDLLLILFVFQYLRHEQGMRLDAESLAARLALARGEAEARTEELNALNATLEERVHQRTVELETMNRELEAFSYSVSHDLRAPLRTVDGFSLALEEDYAEAVDATGRDYIRRVRVGVQRMGQLIDALLQLSRITRAEISKQPCNLTELARTIVDNLRVENPGRAMHFTIGEDLQAIADPALVRVALENLLGNAVKFTSRLTVEAEIEFGWDVDQLAWFVRDNGAGFDMHYQAKLFNAFNRLHGDKDFKGSGIGLATVARVIHRHHGRIWADSVVGRGATFWFTLG